MKLRLVAIIAVLCVPASLPQAGNALPLGAKEASLSWSPGRPEAGENVTFSISASEPNGQISAVRVEYGDGAADTIVTPRSVLRDSFGCVIGDSFSGSVRHRFAHSGDFPVRLIVTSASCPASMHDPTMVISYTVNVVRAGSSGGVPGSQAGTQAGNGPGSHPSTTSQDPIRLPISG